MNDLAASAGPGPKLLDDFRVRSFWNETNVLTIRFGRNGQGEMIRQFSHLRFRQVAQWEAHKIELLRSGGEKEIGLIAACIGSAMQFRARFAIHAANIVTCRQAIGAEIFRRP